MMKIDTSGHTSQPTKPTQYDGMTASAYLEREFASNTKPDDCNCGYPEQTTRNGIGHPSGCPTWLRLAPAYYERKGQEFMGLDDQGRIMVSPLRTDPLDKPPVQKAPVPPEEHAAQAASKTQRIMGPNPNAPTESINIGVGDRANVIDDDGNVWVNNGAVTFLGDDDRIEVLGDKVSGMWPSRFVQPIREDVYSQTITAINEGTVTTAHFNQLLGTLKEASNKSTVDRVNRRTRLTNPEPPEHRMHARVVPSRDVINDPPNQGRGRRYAAGTPAKERQNEAQRKKRSARLHEALSTILSNLDSTPAGVIVGSIEDVKDIRACASALLQSPSSVSTIRGIIGEQAERLVNGDWLFRVLCAADDRLLGEGEDPTAVPSVSLLVEGTAQGTHEKAIPRPAVAGQKAPTITERKKKDEEKKSKRDQKREKESADETRKYEVTGKVRQLDNLEKLFKWVEYCGDVGHSGSATISVDGDGSAHLKFTGVDAEVPETERHSGVELKVGLE